MSSFQTKNGALVSAQTAVVDATDGQLLNGAGERVTEYNDTDGDANGTSYLKTDISDIDSVQVSVSTNDPALSASGVGVQLTNARPAEPSDFFQDDAFVSGTIFFRIADEDGSGEINNDTDISNLEFNVTAYST